MHLKTRIFKCINCGLSIDRDLNAARNLCNWGRLAPGCLLTVNRSHAPVEAESKPLRFGFIRRCISFMKQVSIEPAFRTQGLAQDARKVQRAAGKTRRELALSVFTELGIGNW